MPPGLATLLLTLTGLVTIWVLPASAAAPMSIVALLRCDGQIAPRKKTFCVHYRGPAPDSVFLGDSELPATAMLDQGDGRLRLQLDGEQFSSGPLWLQRDTQVSNAAWLSMQNAHVRAADQKGVVRNSDDIPTYLKLVSVIVEEDLDGCDESQRLARVFGAEIVGAIPALNTYQLELDAGNLIERDAQVLRLGHDTAVDAVVIEETGPEQPVEREITPTDGSAPELDRQLDANRFYDAVDYYRRRISGDSGIRPAPIRVGIIERSVDFQLSDFEALAGPRQNKVDLGLYALDAESPDSHGSIVAGLLAANTSDDVGNVGFLRALAGHHSGFEVMVSRDSDAGITANIAASVNLVEDGVRVLNWSWGVHRVGTIDVKGDTVDSLVRSGLAMAGYEELMEEFFLWLRSEHPDVIVVNSAGNAASFSGADEYRLPSSFVTDQLLVVGAHESDPEHEVEVADAAYARRRPSSNLDQRVDISAAGCVRAANQPHDDRGQLHCGTSYATAVVTGLLSAMLSINPDLSPVQLRELLRRSSLPIGKQTDLEPQDAEDLTAAILPSERPRIDDPDIGYSARLDMREALRLAVGSLSRSR